MEDVKASPYNQVVNEYERNGWSRQLSQEEVEAKDKPKYYLPHHGVYRPEKKSTPLRVVFDPACQYQGVSLNSFLYKGPCLIGNLLGVLLRFREDLVGLVGDIWKMYLQICLPEEDTLVHRYLWRDLDESRDPTVYALQRVTFGDKPSPDMASYVMIKIANENESQCPQPAVILKRDRYMDDLNHSTSTQEEAEKSKGEVDDVLATGSFNIKEWFVSSSVQEMQAENVSSPEEENPDFKGNVIGVNSECTTTKNVNLDGEEGINQNLRSQLFGPFNLKVSQNKSVKAWGAIFTCATVRAIHLEIVEKNPSHAVEELSLVENYDLVKGMSLEDTLHLSIGPL
ncbi:Hypothetical predicted protein [Paramuricea clavata]|uniref:Uncharacterized protein n=1 Tax=Paramuricea clavata TaxID=317549 RepID=A0A6S7J8T3_PARCT|nr:Hypothetical predicted protein [Paramuricea clavata]